MTHPRRRVVVTGMGAICGAGSTANAIIDAAMDGQSAMRLITRFDVRQHTARIAAEISHPMAPGADPYLEWGVRAANEAVKVAGESAFGDSDRTGVILGTAFGSLATYDAMFGEQHDGPWPDLAARLAIATGARGPVLTLTSAFAASADAIGLAVRRIREGSLDVALAGGAEAPITPLIVAGFSAMGALSASNDDPEMAIRPFDLNRNGCGLGEGAALLVLEERERAVARGAKILAELAGYGTSADALHITHLPEDGEGLVRSMAMAINDAGLRPEDIGYINAHGTGTAMNDRVETGAIRQVFGSHADRLGVSSTKPITGHVLGAAGAIEAVITIGALRRGMMPPTANWATRDAECDLDYVPDRPRAADVTFAVSNSMGFGGHNAALILKADEA
jgi:3-oxoacyl-[acyl-carrier-protein] synthase II